MIPTNKDSTGRAALAPFRSFRHSEIARRLGLVALFAAVVSGCVTKGALPLPKENVLRLSLQSRVASLDPHIVNDVYSHQAAALFYEPLYTFHFLKRPYQLEPLLADALPEISRDKKTITIRLKKGVFFHDDPCFKGGKGREVGADDVIYMLERVCTAKTRDEIYGAFEDRLIGAKEFFMGKAKSISGLRKIDDRTVQLKLAFALPRFTSVFADTKTAILPKECVEKYGDEFRNHAVGTGPFLLAPQSNLASKIIGLRNPNYNHVRYPREGNPGDAEQDLLADAGKQLPLVDRVELEVVPEPQPGWLKFLSGDFDIGRIPKDSVQIAVQGDSLAPEYAQKGIKLLRQPRGDVTALVFNLRDPVWGKNRKLRQAVASALNIEEFIRLQYAGQAVRAHSAIDPTQYGFESGFKSRWTAQNLELARKLLEEAGYPGGKGLPPLHFLGGAETAARQLEELLAKQLKTVGIEVRYEAMSFPEMMRKVREGGDFTVFGTGYVSSSGDADDALGVFHSKNIAGGYNASFYKNPLVDRLVDEVERMENGPERLKKIREILEITDDELPLVFMVHRMGNQPAHRWVKNHVFIDESFFGFLKFLRIQTAK